MRVAARAPVRYQQIPRRKGVARLCIWAPPRFRSRARIWAAVGRHPWHSREEGPAQKTRTQPTAAARPHDHAHPRCPHMRCCRCRHRLRRGQRAPPRATAAPRPRCAPARGGSFRDGMCALPALSPLVERAGRGGLLSAGPDYLKRRADPREPARAQQRCATETGRCRRPTLRRPSRWHLPGRTQRRRPRRSLGVRGRGRGTQYGASCEQRVQCRSKGHRQC